MKEKTGRIAVTLPICRITTLEKMAKKKGLPVPTFCRALLAEIAEQEEQKAA